MMEFGVTAPKIVLKALVSREQSHALLIILNAHSILASSPLMAHLLARACQLRTIRSVMMVCRAPTMCAARLRVAAIPQWLEAAAATVYAKNRKTARRARQTAVLHSRLVARFAAMVFATPILTTMKTAGHAHPTVQARRVVIPADATAAGRVKAALQLAIRMDIHVIPRKAPTE